MADLLLGMISQRVSAIARESRSLISVQNDEFGAIKQQKETIHICALVSVLSQPLHPDSPSSEFLKSSQSRIPEQTRPSRHLQKPTHRIFLHLEMFWLPHRVDCVADGSKNNAPLPILVCPPADRGRSQVSRRS
jgi:hypothetical protein